MEDQSQGSGQKSSATPLIAVIILVVAVVGIGYLFVHSSNPGDQSGTGTDSSEPPTPTDTTPVIPPPADTTTPVTPPVTTPPAKTSVKSFTVTGSNFAFSPSEIRVKKGDTVKITFTNSDGFHDWVIDEFNARVPRIGSGKSADVQFVADKTGTFEYYCSVGQHRAMGMKGSLIVE